MTKIKKVIICLIVYSCVLILGLCIRMLYTSQMNSGYYQHAIEQIKFRQYEDAQRLLWKVSENYKDREVLLAYVNEQMRKGTVDQYRAIESVPDDYSGMLCEEILSEKKRVHDEYQALQEELRQMEAREEEERIGQAGELLPGYGMREDTLKYCALGKPSIEYCSNFYSLVPGKRYKTYTYGDPGDPLSGKITVRFRLYNSRLPDGYLDYPSDNGYASSGFYFDADGIRYDFDSKGTERNLHVSPINGKKKTTRPASGSTADKDPYNVQDYDDPEDFYYDWEEDFDGFEDAEQYWDDAQ